MRPKAVRHESAKADTLAALRKKEAYGHLEWREVVGHALLQRLDLRLRKARGQRETCADTEPLKRAFPSRVLWRK